jgi:hypothetical protein
MTMLFCVYVYLLGSERLMLCIEELELQVLSVQPHDISESSSRLQGHPQPSSCTSHLFCCSLPVPRGAYRRAWAHSELLSHQDLSLLVL